MDQSKETFFDYPLDKKMYMSKPLLSEKPPLRVLVTEAGNKIAYCLMYKICTGEVFGPHREVYIHMLNAKGVIDHKTTIMELEECGFHLLKGSVVTSNLEEAFDGVDVVIFINAYEEQWGYSHNDTFAAMIIRGRLTMKNIADYAKPNVRIVIASGSTKSSLIQLYVYHQLEPRIPAANMTAVTIIDEAIARAHLAARLKTTTNKIRNIVIWGLTCPDVHYATVRMKPPGDLGALEEVELPVLEALQDDNYIHDEFIQCIFRRKIGHEFLKAGKGLSIAIARHLRALYVGPENDEIFSMGVLTPSNEPYGIPNGFPFSYPVTASNGTWKITENLKYDSCTHLNFLKTLENFYTGSKMISLNRVISYILEYEETQNETIRLGQRQELTKLLKTPKWEMSLFISPLPTETLPRTVKERVKMDKFITWDDLHSTKRTDELPTRKSSIRFSFDEAKKQDRKGSILKSNPMDRHSLPQISVEAQAEAR